MDEQAMEEEANDVDAANHENLPVGTDAGIFHMLQVLV
jgi:hypothetical protein